MNLAIVGPGAIGSTLAFQLARAGHRVTVVARGQRLAQLQATRAIVRNDGVRAEVDVAAELDTTTQWDAVLVTVLAPQVAAVLPALTASRARRVIFMFNTFESLAPLREAVGAERFAFAFPAGVFCLLRDGVIHPTIRGGTVSGDAAWAKHFTDAGVPTEVEPDMQSWLRTHAAMVAPLMAIGVVAHEQKRGATWRESSRHAAAFTAGFELVRAHGDAIRPTALGTLSRFPGVLLTLLFWFMSRSKLLRDLGALGATEPRMLIDMMKTAKPTHAAALVAIRP